MSQATADRVGPRRDLETHVGQSDPSPGWATVFLVIALLCFAALPRSIVVTGISPLIIVVSAVVVVLWKFGKE
jgi:hypothetical protein